MMDRFRRTGSITISYNEGLLDYKSHKIESETGKQKGGLIRCRTHDVESMVVDYYEGVKVTTKDGITIGIAPSDISLVLKLEGDERQKVLGEVMEHIPWETAAKLITIIPYDVKWALEEYILCKRIDNGY